METPCTFCNGHGSPFGHPCPDCSPEYNPEPCTFCNAPATHVNTHTDGTDPVPACSVHDEWPACCSCGNPAGWSVDWLIPNGGKDTRPCCSTRCAAAVS